MKRTRPTLVIAGVMAFAGGCAKTVPTLTTPDSGSSSVSAETPQIHGGENTTTTDSDSTTTTERGGGWAGSGH